MEKFFKIVLIIVIICILVLIGLGIKQIARQMNANGNFGLEGFASNIENKSYTMKAVVLKVNEKSLIVKSDSIYSCGFAKEGNIGFKMGQEILIYYDGMILATYPGQISKVEKIEILKEKSDIEISEDDMRYCYSRLDNVSVEVDFIINTGISFTITDNNKYKYDYSKAYVITKKNKEAEEENKIIEERNRKIIEQETQKLNEQDKGKNYVSAFNGDGILEPLKKVWEEVPKISSLKSEDTGSYSEKGNTYTRNYNWVSMYGFLGEGEYQFKTKIKGITSVTIEIDFTIDKNGKVTYSEPIIGTV